VSQGCICLKAFKQEVVLAKMREAAEQLSLRMGYTKPEITYDQ
jgi:hypothetical protein